MVERKSRKKHNRNTISITQAQTWEESQKFGRKRFIVTLNIVTGLTSALMCVIFYFLVLLYTYEQPGLRLVYIVGGSLLVLGLFYYPGRWYWDRMESRYREFRQRHPTYRPLLEITDPNLQDLQPAEDVALGEKPIAILFLAADPTDSARLRLGEELREIQEKLQLARLRERFQLHQRMSVRPADISQALLDVQPQIVHFAGHGTAEGELCFENQVGQSHPVSPEALAALFEQFSDLVDCVVLNACYSDLQARAIARHIDTVVGTHQAVGDQAAIAFAIGFYQALGAGRKFPEAYQLGCVQMSLQGVDASLQPILVKREDNEA